MNVLSNSALRARDGALPQPLCGPASVQELPHLPSGYGLGSGMTHAPVLNLQRSTKPQRELSPEEQQELRRKINSRERKRMQDLNVAMDALREVMVPYASSPSAAATSHSHQPGAPPGRRLSKISTLVLARNYILLLGSSLQEMRRLLGEVSVGVGVNSGPVPRLLLAGGWPLISGPGQLLLAQESLISSGAAATPSPSTASSAAAATAAAGKCALLSPGPAEVSMIPMQWSSRAGGGALCSCGVCRLPGYSHSTATNRFSK